jgi:hypothetical protein
MIVPCFLKVLGNGIVINPIVGTVPAHSAFIKNITPPTATPRAVFVFARIAGVL